MGNRALSALLAAVAACGAMTAGAAAEDIVVAPGGEVTVGPTAASTNNSRHATITFEDGGTIKASPLDQNGQPFNGFYMWRDFFVNGTVKIGRAHV